MNYNTILAGIFIIIILLIIGRILIEPIKIFLKLIYSSSLGAAGIFLFNLLGSIAGLHMGFNFITILTVGILGIPGFALILMLQLMFRT